ncbi:MAG: multiprotein bridging factor aMBF1 [Aeropyrum sp.]|nr:multiprotein bridging factor aMBF1 [Aeropyrum sp.]MCE4616701.1 multiprotein bridging factor aMBF1 [Aeropyrum sp.]
MRQSTVYCDICGSPIQGRPYRALVDGAEMVLCLSCYMRLSRGGRAQPVREAKPRRPRGVRRPRRLAPDMYDLVEDYPERIREAREARGWSTAVLAQKLRISETMLRKIEAGKLKPSLDLARRMEKVLGTKLLEPVVDEDVYYGDDDYGRDYVTLGDIVVIDRDEE